MHMYVYNTRTHQQLAGHLLQRDAAVGMQGSAVCC